MRFIDLALLQIPEGWSARAQQALNDLRTEIANAEVEAQNNGTNLIGARKRAIVTGLGIPNRQQIWRDLNPALSLLSQEKCWYSESHNPASDKNVDHFRPKGRVVEDPDHEGYWWLAFAPSNYRYSSQWCNQRRLGPDGTDGGKADHFPLLPNGVRAMQEADDLQLEDPELLDPTDPDDWKLLTFLPDGYPTPARASGTPEHRRAAKSIDVYHLHCKPLANGRFAVAGTIKRMVQELETLRPKLNDLTIRKLYKDRQVDLLRAVHPNSEYSAAARAYARAEVYKLEGGHQIKRDWLEEILT